MEKIAHALAHTLERPHPKSRPLGTKSALQARAHCPAPPTARATCNSGDCDCVHLRAGTAAPNARSTNRPMGLLWRPMHARQESLAAQGIFPCYPFEAQGHFGLLSFFLLNAPYPPGPSSVCRVKTRGTAIPQYCVGIVRRRGPIPQYWVRYCVLIRRGVASVLPR